MKKSVLILCFALFTLNSCSKNDDNLIQTQASILGKWKIQSSSSGTLPSCTLNNATYHFFADNTAIETDGHLSSTINGNICVQSTFKEIYTLNNNILVIKEVGYTGTDVSQFTFNVLEVTSTTLKLKYVPTNTTATYIKVN